MSQPPYRYSKADVSNIVPSSLQFPLSTYPMKPFLKHILIYETCVSNSSSGSGKSSSSNSNSSCGSISISISISFSIVVV